MIDFAGIYLTKATDALACSESEFMLNRPNNVANRCYYACFQAAIAALLRVNIQPSGKNWTHEFVQSQFNGQLINRRNIYPASLRNTLRRAQILRERADYSVEWVHQRDASQALQDARAFVDAVRGEIHQTS